MPDDITNRRPFLIVDNDRIPAVRPGRPLRPEDIPPRPWLYGSRLLRGYVSILAGPPADGKTTHAMTIGLAVASGRPLLGDRVFLRANVALLNFEHAYDELLRRQAAAMSRHGIKCGSACERFFPMSAPDRWVTNAVQTTAGKVIYPKETAIRREIVRRGIDALMIDAFAEGHGSAEDREPEILKATAAWQQIARTTNCAILLVHDVSTPSPQTSRLRVVLERPPEGV